MTVLASVGDTFNATAANGPLLLAAAVCLLAGIVSFASPCVVPLVPGYLSYLAGLVGAEAPEINDADGQKAQSGFRDGRWRVTGAALLFVAGFTAVFLALTYTVLGLTTVLSTNLQLLQRIGGVVTILMGLVYVGFVPMLQSDKRFHPRRISGLVGAPLLGAVFALGWTPCLSPTLAGAISVSVGTEGSAALRGLLLTGLYCLGLGLPFIALALGSAIAVRALGFFRKYARTIQIFGGVMLIVVGLALVTGAWDMFITNLRDTVVSDWELPI